MKHLVTPLPLWICFETYELSCFHSHTNDNLRVCCCWLRYDKESYLVISCIHIRVLLLLMDWTRIEIVIHALLGLPSTVKKGYRNLLLIVICEYYRFFVLRLHIDNLLLRAFCTEFDSVALHLTHTLFTLIMVEFKLLHHFKPFFTMNWTTLLSSSVFWGVHGRQIIEVSRSIFEHFKFLLGQTSIIIVDNIDIVAVIRHSRSDRRKLVKRGNWLWVLVVFINESGYPLLFPASILILLIIIVIFFNKLRSSLISHPIDFLKIELVSLLRDILLGLVGKWLFGCQLHLMRGAYSHKFWQYYHFYLII